MCAVRCPFHPRVTAVARKTRTFCQKCRWQVTPKHACTLDPTKSEWADYVAVQAWCGNLSGNELTRNSSGNTRSRWSQLAEPLYTDPGLKSGIKKKFFKAQAGMNCLTFSPNPRRRGKKSHNHLRLPYTLLSARPGVSAGKRHQTLI